jgi:hypothetical protein
MKLQKKLPLEYVDLFFPFSFSHEQSFHLQSFSAPLLWESTVINDFGEYKIIVICEGQQNYTTFMVFAPTFEV